jgi:hypothetical protein
MSVYQSALLLAAFICGSTDRSKVAITRSLRIPLQSH